jgi:lipopolysaccharide export system permease protein
MILFFYVFNKLLSSLLTIAAILIGALWLTQSLRFIAIIVNHNISFFDYCLLVSLLLPDLISLVLPLCLIFSSLWIYYQLIVDHEFLAMQALGLDIAQLTRPLLCLSSCVFVTVFILNIYITPLSFSLFRDLEHHMKQEVFKVLLKEGTFSTFKNTSIFVDEQNQDGSYGLIFIDMPSQHLKNTTFNPNQLDSDRFVTFIAREGRFDSRNQLFILKDGYRQIFNEKGLQTLSFELLTYDVKNYLTTDKKRSVRLYEKSIRELLFPNTLLDLKSKRKHLIEGHTRLLSPLLALLNPLLVIRYFLIPSSQASVRRRFQRRKIVGAFIPIILSQLVFHGFLHIFGNLFEKYNFAFLGFFWIYVIFLSIILYLFFSKRTWRSS